VTAGKRCAGRPWRVSREAHATSRHLHASRRAPTWASRTRLEGESKQFKEAHAMSRCQLTGMEEHGYAICIGLARQARANLPCPLPLPLPLPLPSFHPRTAARLSLPWCPRAVHPTRHRSVGKTNPRHPSTRKLTTLVVKHLPCYTPAVGGQGKVVPRSYPTYRRDRSAWRRAHRRTRCRTADD
jgi:hypothetical protein